jgi:hypothetical protein
MTETTRPQRIFVASDLSARCSAAPQRTSCTRWTATRWSCALAESRLLQGHDPRSRSYPENH